MALEDDLARIAALAGRHGEVAGVLAAEPARAVRRYLVALGPHGQRRWAVLDDAGEIVGEPQDIRDVASIVAMCEVGQELSGGVGEAPRVATPALLDEIGAAAVTRGDASFSDGIRAATAVVDAFVKDVESRYLIELG
jgi:hypothetical protein